ncbi:retrovirus-related pol polyprotein from transposon TNT 1-94, partial [Tanacetum coccineum]
MVHQLTKFHVQRVDMVINPPWNLPFLGAKGLTSPEQTATVDLDLFKLAIFLQRLNRSKTKDLHQGLPKDIYKLINHNIEAKAIWDNVKMLLAGSELTKEDRESQLYDEFKRFKMLPGENINEYYVRFHKLVNDMRNIIMTMPNIQLNSKFVNNMSLEWDRFVTAIKLNKGLKETNHEQLYAYLKQHEKHAAQDRLIIERITPTTNDQLAFVSTVQPYAQSSHVQSHQYSSSSTTLQSPHIQSLQHPQFPETSQIDSGHTQTDEILDNLTKQMALLAQSFRATLPQTNNQLRTSSNTRNQATVQDGRIVVQNVQGRQNQNQNQRYLARGNGAAGNGGAHNRAGNANAGQGKPIKCYNCNGLGHIARNCTQPKRPQNSDYFKDKMLLMQAQENGAVLDEEELLFLAGEQANTFDADVDNHPVQDLALNEDNIFQADECDAFDSDVDDEPTAQSIFMANLSSAGPANLQAGPSNASTLSEVHILENAIDHSVTNQDRHEIHNEVQQANVIDSTSVDMGNSNVIPYEQYLSVNNVSVVPSCASSALNDACVLFNNDVYVPHNPIATELKIYKKQVAIYEQRATFEPTKREKRMDDQMRLLIQNHNKTEENLKKELHYVKLQLNSTMENNKIIEETEDLELAEATRNKMHAKMNDSACVEKRVNITPPNYSKENFMATFTPQTQLTPEQVFWSLDLEKRKAEELKANAPPLPVLPPATVYPPNTPVHLVPRTLPTTSQVNIGLYVITQLFWDFEKTCKKRITPTGITEGERGFEQTKRCYLTEVIPFFNLLKEHFDGVQKSLVTEVRAMKAVFENLEAEVDQNEIDLKSSEIERKNLLIANENLIAECLSKDVFYTATDSVLNVSRFSDMHDAFTTAQKRIANLESENFNLRNKIQNDDHDSLIKHFSKLEVEHFNLQLKYQNLKERFGTIKPVTSSDAPSFDSLFVIGQLTEQIQSRGNTIRELKEKISRLTKKNSDADPLFDLKALVSQNKELTAKLNALHDLNERFRAENAKVKQHYKELYDSIKITRAKTIEHKNSLLTEIENLKAQLKENSKCVTISDGKPKVLAPGVKGASTASGSKPKSNTKKDRTFPAKSALKQVEAHSRMNKSNEKQKNHADSSISYKRTVINSNSNTSCKTSNKCLIYVNHDQCVVRSEVFIKQSPATKVWRVKQDKQVWQATGKLFTTIGHQWRLTDRLLPLGDQCPLTRNTPPKVLPIKQWKPTGRILPLERQCPLVRSTTLKSGCMPADPQENVTSVVQIVLWYLDLGCSKHMTGDRSRLRNFVKKFIETVRFGNDHFGAIMGYRDYVIGDSVISRVYYVEGLGHNLFSVGQFCDSDLEVAFRKHTCFVRDLDGVDLIKGNRGTNLYTISVEDMIRSSPICLLSKASKNKSWLWHRRLNHLNFGTLNDLAHKDLVRGLPLLKFDKDHLCSACQLGKSRKATHKPKTINTIMEVLHTLHMDLCGPLRDETPAFVINLLKQLQVGLNKIVRFAQTDNGTEFVNKDLTDYYESIDITHEKTVLRTPQQNGIVKRRNRTLVEAARTMLIFSKAPLFLWAEVVATVCYTQNRSLIHTLHDKTPYELVHDKKLDLSFLRVFGALCYPTNDSEDLGKLKAKADIRFFVGYAPNRKGYRIYNKQTRQIMETIHVTFDELTGQTTLVHSSPGPAPNFLKPMFDEYFENPPAARLVPPTPVAQVSVNQTGPSVSISVNPDAPLESYSPSSTDHQSSSVHIGVVAEHSIKVNHFASADPKPFVNVFALEPSSEASSSR